MKTWTTIFLLALCGFSFSQNTGEVAPPRLFIEIHGGTVMPWLRNSPVPFILCFEGCQTILQSSVMTVTYGMLTGYRITKRHQIQIGLNAGKYRFDNEMLDSFTGTNFSRESVHRYTSLSLYHQFDLIRGRLVAVFIRNGLSRDANQSDYIFNLKKSSLSYEGQAGVAFHVAEKWDVSLSGQFRAAITRMSEDYPGDWDKAYFPYAYGMLVGVRRWI